MTQTFERKLGQGNLHKRSHPGTMQQQHREQLNTPVHQQALRCALRLMQISERCPLNSRLRPVVLLCPTYLFASRSAEQTRKKRRGSLGGAPREHDSNHGSQAISPR